MEKKIEYEEFDTLKNPKKTSMLLYPIMIIASFFMKLINGHKIKKINCKGLKGPYIVLSTHASMLDMDMLALATFPHRINWVTAIDEFTRGEWLMRNLGCTYKRKFTLDLVSLRHMMYCIKKLKSILVIYPEARFSFAGITERLDGALGKFVKKMGVPLVVMRNYGHFLNSPQWCKHPYRKVKMISEYEQILTKEDVEKLSAEEIQDKLTKALQINEYDYQHEHTLRINNKERMTNSHKVLYKCPHCGKEFMMEGKGTTITCHNCGITYELDEYGYLHNLNGETKFNDIPSWYNWEKEEVIKEVKEGKYYFEDEVDLEQLYKPKVGYIQKGRMKFIHDYDGMKLTGKLSDGSDFEFIRPSIEQQSCHVEFNFANHEKKIGEAIDFANTKVTYFGWLVHNKEALTKIHFATEVLYDYNREKLNIK